MLTTCLTDRDSQQVLTASYNEVHPPLQSRGAETAGRSRDLQLYSSSLGGDTTDQGQQRSDMEIPFLVPPLNSSGGSTHQKGSNFIYGSNTTPGVASSQSQAVQYSVSYPRKYSHSRPGYEALSGGTSNCYYSSPSTAPSARHDNGYSSGGIVSRYSIQGTATSGGHASYYEAPSTYGSGYSYFESSFQSPTLLTREDAPSGQTSRYPATSSESHQAGDGPGYNQSGSY